MKKRTFVLPDIHGMYDKLVACLQAVNFDYESDRLIQLGDVVDRGPDSFLVVEELLKIVNLVAIRGNHDATFRDAIKSGDLSNNILYNQGGRETRQSYYKHSHKNDKGEVIIPNTHMEFFINTQKNYWIDKNKNLFVHGGFNRHEFIEGQSENVLIWDRDLFLAAMSYEGMKNSEHPFRIKDKFNHIYVGHTPTIYWNITTPITVANITNLDCGCGKGGKLTIFNLDTKEYIQK